jgi:hypothetical protein
MGMRWVMAVVVVGLLTPRLLTAVLFAATPTPITLRLNVRVAVAPVKVHAEVRYNSADFEPAQTLCLLVDSEDGEQHSSCWVVEPGDAPLKTIDVLIEHSGMYQAQVVSISGKRSSNVVQFVLQ